MDTSGISERLLALPTNETIGRYRLIAELGSGGMANVYLAVMKGRADFSKLVVLKVPREAVTEDPNLLSMFLDEARLAARLNHRNVVQTYEVVEEDGRDVIVMEYLEGQTLNEVLGRARRRNKPLTLPMHLRIVSEALEGLHYAHEAKNYDGEPLGIVHRDVSPHNIFVTFDGEVKMLDFGIAKAATSSHVTQVGTFKGKVRYMPPEQFDESGATDIDRRADLFAVGAVLWEAVTGTKLWKGIPDSEVIQNISANKIPRLADVMPDVHPQLDAIVTKALAFDRKDRFTTCLELKAELDRYLGDVDLKAVGAVVSELFSETRAARKRIISEQVSRVEEGGAAPLSSSSEALDSAAPASFPIQAKAKTHAKARRNWLPIVLAGVGLVGLALAAVLPRRFATSGDITVTLSAQPKGAVLYLDGKPLGANPWSGHVARDGARHSIRAEAKDHVTKSLDVFFENDKEVVLGLENANCNTP